MKTGAVGSGARGRYAARGRGGGRSAKRVDRGTCGVRPDHNHHLLLRHPQPQPSTVQQQTETLLLLLLRDGDGADADSFSLAAYPILSP